MKRIPILLSVLVSVLTLFAYTEAMAAGDCSNGQNTCWDFGLGYRIEVYPAQFGVIDPNNGKIRYTYQVSKTKNASANFLGLGIDSGVKVSPPPLSNYTTLFPVCAGDTTTSVGVGDCYRQWAKWDPSQNTISYINLYVEQKGSLATMPIAMKGGTGYTVEMGAILGPGIPPPPVADTTKILSFDDIKLELTFDQNTGELVTAMVIPSDGSPKFPADITDLTTASLTICLGDPPLCQPLSLQWASDDCRLRGHGSGTCTSYPTYVMGKPILVTTCTCQAFSDCPTGLGYRTCTGGICKR